MRRIKNACFSRMDGRSLIKRNILPVLLLLWLLFPLVSRAANVENLSVLDPDLPPDVEIHHTLLPMECLIFRPEDKSKELRRFVLVAGQDGVYVVVGGWDCG
jgi:hypothetical protein